MTFTWFKRIVDTNPFHTYHMTCVEVGLDRWEFKCTILPGDWIAFTCAATVGHQLCRGCGTLEPCCLFVHMTWRFCARWVVLLCDLDQPLYEHVFQATVLCSINTVATWCDLSVCVCVWSMVLRWGFCDRWCWVEVAASLHAWKVRIAKCTSLWVFPFQDLVCADVRSDVRVAQDASQGLDLRWQPVCVFGHHYQHRHHGMRRQFSQYQMFLVWSSSPCAVAVDAHYVGFTWRTQNTSGSGVNVNLIVFLTHSSCGQSLHVVRVSH